MGTEGEYIYQSLGLEDLAVVSPSARILSTPSLAHSSFLSTGGFTHTHTHTHTHTPPCMFRVWDHILCWVLR